MSIPGIDCYGLIISKFFYRYVYYLTEGGGKTGEFDHICNYVDIYQMDRP